eukprot:354622-Chlamydomonas_euryale.AAC.13
MTKCCKKRPVLPEEEGHAPHGRNKAFAARAQFSRPGTGRENRAGWVWYGVAQDRAQWRALCGSTQPTC